MSTTASTSARYPLAALMVLTGLLAPASIYAQSDGVGLPGGVYFYRLTTPAAQHVRAMTLLR